MAVSLAKSRSILAASVVFVAAVAMLVAVGVIPPVRVTTAPDIRVEDAVFAFWMAFGLHLLAASLLLLTAALSKGRSRISTTTLVVIGIAILFFGFVLSDAARAFGAAGPSLRTVTMLLYLCVAADTLAGALTLTAAFLRPARALSNPDGNDQKGALAGS